MNVPILRLYADTSVFGGVFDEGFEEASIEVFRQVREGRFQLVTSPLVQTEINEAPERVRQFFDEMLEYMEIVELSDAATQLKQAYLDAGIVTPKSEVDALHVALASVSGCQLIVSWNFKHIVNFQKIPLYQAINSGRGYAEIEIYSPPEVITYDEAEEDF